MSSWKRYFLVVTLTAIAGTALLGVLAVLTGELGEGQGKILVLCACVTGAGLFTLACLNARERDRLGPLPIAGITAAAGGFALVAYGAWAESDSDDYWRLAVTLVCLGAWVAYVSTLSLARLAPQFRWSFTTAFLLSAALTAAGLLGLWNSDAASGNYWRVFGALAVLVAASALVVPILNRAGRSAPTRTTGVHAAYCPRCGRAVSHAGACQACGARFEVRFRQS